MSLPTARGKFNQRHIHEYELVDNISIPSRTDGFGINPTISYSTAPPNIADRHVRRHSFPHFTLQNPCMVVSFFLGTIGAFACFAFTYWLSTQVFSCPWWAVECKSHAAVHFFVSRLGLVQGFVSSIYGVCISGIAYATYQLAETTLWPALCRHDLTLRGIERFLAHARGSLASFPHAMWYTSNPIQIFVVIMVGIIGLLLHVNSLVVGWTFTVMPVPSTLLSNHSQGGGMGFGFTQSNPPAPFNGELQRAYSMYAAWSSSQSQEMLPDLREYVLDRNNFSLVGNFTVGAVRATRQTHCYGAPLNLTKQQSYMPTMYSVASNLYGTTLDGVATDYAPVLLRFDPNAFTAWVHFYEALSLTSARTTIMFATLNSTFEGGYTNTALVDECESVWSLECSGISSLACDVVIDLEQGQACNGPCSNTTMTSASNVTWIGDYGGIELNGNTINIWPIAVSISAAATQLGQFIYGAQPLYVMPAPTNTSLVLPVIYTDVSESGPSQHFTQASLINFIDVAAGAMAIAIPQGWPGIPTTIETTIDLLRLQTSRSYVLLVPPSIAIASVLLLILLSASMHRLTGLRVYRLGWLSEILISASHGDVLDVMATEGFQRLTEDRQVAALEDKKLRLTTLGGGEQALLVQPSL